MSAGARIVRAVDDADTAAAESRRPPAAKFAPAPVSIPGERRQVWKKVSASVPGSEIHPCRRPQARGGGGSVAP
jgi:hypothetical protein